jgi:outer membrane protein
MRLSPTRAALAAALVFAGSCAAAQTTVYLGGAYIDIHSKAPALEGGPAVPPPGGLIEVGDAKTVVFGAVHHFAPQWSVEAALGIPPEHKTYGRGFLQPFGQISSVKQVAPTVFVNYHFGAPEARLRPFVGLGLNYTHFTDARGTASGDAASGGPSRIELDDSWGAAVHAGASWAIDKRWSVIGTVAYADVKSDVTATTTTPTGTIVRTTRIDFRPVVYTLSLGYSF